MRPQMEGHKFGYRWQQWCADWQSRNIEALNGWWGRFKAPRRHQTGEIAIEEIRQASPVALLEAPRDAQLKTDKVELSLIPTLPLNQRQQQQEDEDWNAPTVQVRAILPVQPEPISLPDASLPLDERGRPYLRIDASTATTEELVHVGVARFRQLTGLYPSTILLSLKRYMALEDARYYIVDNVSIPLDCEGLAEYDVLLKRY